MLSGCRHRLLVFRDQGIVSGERQVEISRWFGELESTFYKHPHSPHPDVFRVSNDEQTGCTGESACTESAQAVGSCSF